MKVRDIMTEKPQCAAPGTTIGEVARIMRDHDVGMVPVASEGRLLGVITDRDIVIRVAADSLNPFETSVQDFMSPNPVSVSPDTSIDEVREIMSERQIRRVLVTEDDKLVGVVSLGDVATKSKDKKADESTGQVLEDISEPTK